MTLILTTLAALTAACDMSGGDDGSDGSAAGAIADSATMAGDVDRGAPTAADFTDENVFGFLTMVDNAEMEAAKVAREKATHADVRELARMLETEHARMVKQSGALAARLRLDVEPPPTDELATMHSQAMRRLSELPEGLVFDQEYARTQVRTHTRVLQVLQDAATSPRPDSVAARLLRVTDAVRSHLEVARRVQQAVGGA